MKSTLLSAAIGMALAGASAQAASATSPDEIAQIREQLQGLIERVGRLEQENTVLRFENQQLKAQGDDLQAETRSLREDSAKHGDEAAKVESADWARRIALKGDLRYRHEQISDDTVSADGTRTADRYRHRIRARLNAEVQATDDMSVGIGFATAEDGDPRSSNQSLTDVFSRKSIDLDTAYFDWQFAAGGHLIGGKMKQPFVEAGQSLFWDNDINPEGLALTFERGILFGSVHGYWVDEVSAAESAVTSDTMLFGGQFGARMPLAGAADLMLAAQYYDLGAGQGRAPFFDGNPNGNTTVDIGTPPTAVLLNDYRVVSLMAEFNTKLGEWPLQLWADVARNQGADDFDSAWEAGALFGKASDFRTWEFGAAYMVLEKDALFAQLIDSDFANGESDSEGWVLRAAYAPVKNWNLSGTYFLNQRNRDVPNAAGQTGVDYERLQLDFNVKF